MNKTAIKNDFRRLPKNYGDLAALLPPRPIHDDVDLANTTEMIDRPGRRARAAIAARRHISYIGGPNSRTDSGAAA